MSADEFWKGAPKLAVAYKEAYKIQRRNRFAAEWRQGLYVREALISAAPFFREWSKGVEYDYPLKPIFDDAQGREDKAIEHMEENKNRFLNFMHAFNAKFGEEPPRDEC